MEQGLKNGVIIDAQNCELGHSLSQIKTSPRTKAVMICAVQIVTQSSRSTSLFLYGMKKFWQWNRFGGRFKVNICSVDHDCWTPTGFVTLRVARNTVRCCWARSVPFLFASFQTSFCTRSKKRDGFKSSLHLRELLIKLNKNLNFHKNNFNTLSTVLSRIYQTTTINSISSIQAMTTVERTWPTLSLSSHLNNRDKAT